MIRCCRGALDVLEAVEADGRVDEGGEVVAVVRAVEGHAEEPFLFEACPVAADRALVHTEPRGQRRDARVWPLGRLPVGPQLTDVVPFGRRDTQGAAVPYDDAGDRRVPVVERGPAVT